MIRSVLAMVTFVLAMSLLNIELWGSMVWFKGGIAGIAIGVLWHATRNTAFILGWVGILILIAALFGVGENLSTESTAFFNGMSLGLLIGFLLSAWLRWGAFRPKLISIARFENESWLLRLLGEDVPL